MGFCKDPSPWQLTAVVHRDKHSPDGNKCTDPPLPKGEWRGTGVVPQQHPWHSRGSRTLSAARLPHWGGCPRCGVGAESQFTPTESQSFLPGLAAALCCWGNTNSKALMRTQG